MTTLVRNSALDQEQFHSLLGVQVNALTLADLKERIGHTIASKQRQLITHHNLHSVFLYHHDEKMRALFAKADCIYIDGMALVYLGKLLGLPLQPEHRMTGVDWLEPILSEAAQQGWRVFFLGSKPGVAERSAEIFREKLPGLQIATANGYFDATPDSPENQAIVSKINAYQPHLVMVGMGMPRQEHWTLDNFQSLSANVVINVGALMDYFAGELKTPPRWAGQIGIEWLFRLLYEPRRLWRRYLVEPGFVLKVFLAEYGHRLLSLNVR